MLVRYIENKTFALTEANLVLLLYLTRLRNAVRPRFSVLRPRTAILYSQLPFGRKASLSVEPGIISRLYVQGQLFYIVSYPLDVRLAYRLS